MATLTSSIKLQNYRLEISDSINSFSRDWQTLSHGNIYAEPEYLSLLEHAGPKKYSYCYAILYDGILPIAAFYFQLKKIRLSEDFKVHTHSKNAFKRLAVFLQKAFFKLINKNLLICGNVLLTGEYGFGTNRKFSLSGEVINDVINNVVNHLKSKKQTVIHGILCKDFFEKDDHKELEFNVEGFTEFRVQPAMILPVDSSWNNFDDYISAVKSKYRVKFNKTIKQAKALDFRQLELDDIKQLNDQMYKLYESTANRAVFSLFHLAKDYFLELKKTLKDKIIFIGIFNSSQLLGFYTFVINNEYGDAHFIGYDVKQNSKYQIYFNILLGLVKLAIDSKVKFLNLSRTALEIKSSVGAEPHEMFIYLRYENRLINKFIPSILKRVVPKNDWEVRSPFK